MSELDGPGATTVEDHPYEPRGEWWTVCKVCGLAEAAHVTTTRGGGPEPELPPASTHDVNMLDTHPVREGDS